MDIAENVPFIKKYRPLSFDDPHLVETEAVSLVAGMDVSSLPHLLFHGNPGLGKSLCAELLAKKMHGEEYRDYYLKLNMSKDRGIDVIRGEVNDFASYAAPYGTRRVLHLDEAEKMTRDAQDALRGVMDDRERTCLFVLTTNHVERIDEAIRSRCENIHFKRPSKSQVMAQLEAIASDAGIAIDADCAVEAVRRSQGDLRYVPNLLQANALLRHLSLSNVVFPVDAGGEIWEMIKSGDWMGAVQRVIDEDCRSLLLSLHRSILLEAKNGLSPELARDLLIINAGYESSIAEGSDGMLQAQAAVSELCREYSNRVVPARERR